MAASTPGLTRRVKKILQIDIHDEGLQQALAGLSDIYPEMLTKDTPIQQSELKCRIQRKFVAVTNELLADAQAFVDVRPCRSPNALYALQIHLTASGPRGCRRHSRTMARRT